MELFRETLFINHCNKKIDVIWSRNKLGAGEKDYINFSYNNFKIEHSFSSSIAVESEFQRICMIIDDFGEKGLIDAKIKYNK